MGGGRQELLDRARDELFSHINSCKVLEADAEDQEQWMDETIDYLGERYPDLSPLELQALRDVGMRFCRPAIPHGDPGQTSAENTGEEGEGANGA